MSMHGPYCAWSIWLKCSTMSQKSARQMVILIIEFIVPLRKMVIPWQNPSFAYCTLSQHAKRTLPVQAVPTLCECSTALLRSRFTINQISACMAGTMRAQANLLGAGSCPGQALQSKTCSATVSSDAEIIVCVLQPSQRC